METFWDEVINPLFMPHGHCYLWKPGLLWLHVASDVLITLAYYSIPFALLYFIRKRRDLAFHSVFIMFSIFIFACGTTHLMGIFNTWKSYYWIEGFIKGLTALSSVGTALMMWPLIPKALKVPSPKMLTEKNEMLQREILERQRAEEALQAAHEQLEQKVRERTAELETLNRILEAQIRDRERAEERYRTLVTATSSVIWNTNADGAFAEPQPSWEAFTGQSPSDYQDPEWGWGKAVHPDDIEALKKKWARHLESCEVYEIETRVWNQAAEMYRYVAVKSVPLKEQDGSVREWIGSITDIDEKKRAQEAIKSALDQLEMSNRELERFAYIASHDLQEPLRKIQTFGDRLANKHAEGLDDKGRHYLDRILVSASRMQHLIRSLLLYSRTQTKERHYQPIELANLVSEVESSLEVRLAETHGTIETDLSHAHILGDSLLIHQLFLNLIGNSLKFHRPDIHPVITVSSDDFHDGDSDYIRVRVADNGIGIEEKYLDRIFSPFQRLHSREEFEGTGMGLAICQKIMDLHQGRIGVFSEVGQGTTFLLDFPTSPQQPMIEKGGEKSP